MKDSNGIKHFQYTNEDCFPNHRDTRFLLFFTGISLTFFHVKYVGQVNYHKNYDP